MLLYSKFSFLGQKDFDLDYKNNDLKVSEHAYLFSSGSNDYWSWRKPSEIQVGDYLLGINEEIRQVSSSEQIVNGTIGLSQINVEDVDTLFVNGYLVHNGLEDDPGGGCLVVGSVIHSRFKPNLFVILYSV